MTWPRDLEALVRPRIGLLASAGAGGGWLMAVGPVGEEMALALAGAFLLSCGCSALNQLQERDVDALMERTRDRPLPAGRMRPAIALALALAWLAAAALALALAPGGFSAAALVPLTVLVYNGLYTPLKRRTSLAMLVGGVSGALPPVVGFAAAQGLPAALSDPRSLLLAGVFYAWQVPHFWLFALSRREQYERAGLRVPLHGVEQGRAPAALRLWLAGYGAAMLLLPAFGLVSAPALRWLVAGLALGMICCPGLSRGQGRLGFALVNASLALLLACIAADALGLAA